MKLKYKFVVREVGDAFVAVAVGPATKDFNGLVRMNKTGKDIFELMQNEISEDEIVEALLKKYEGTAEEILGKVRLFVTRISEQGLVE